MAIMPDTLKFISVVFLFNEVKLAKQSGKCLPFITTTYLCHSVLIFLQSSDSDLLRHNISNKNIEANFETGLGVLARGTGR